MHRKALRRRWVAQLTQQCKRMQCNAQESVEEMGGSAHTTLSRASSSTASVTRRRKLSSDEADAVCTAAH